MADDWLGLRGRVCVVTGAASGIGAAIARELCALGARVARSRADVIGVEQIGVVRVVGFVAGDVFAEQKLLPEPGDMGPVPFGRAGVRHGLDQLILGGERGGPTLRLVPDGPVGCQQSCGLFRAGFRGENGGIQDAGIGLGGWFRHKNLRLGGERCFSGSVPQQDALDRAAFRRKKAPWAMKSIRSGGGDCFRAGAWQSRLSQRSGRMAPFRRFDWDAKPFRATYMPRATGR